MRYDVAEGLLRFAASSVFSTLLNSYGNAFAAQAFSLYLSSSNQLALMNQSSLYGFVTQNWGDLHSFSAQLTGSILGANFGTSVITGEGLVGSQVVGGFSHSVYTPRPGSGGSSFYH